MVTPSMGSSSAPLTTPLIVAVCDFKMPLIKMRANKICDLNLFRSQQNNENNVDLLLRVHSKINNIFFGVLLRPGECGGKRRFGANPNFSLRGLFI